MYRTFADDLDYWYNSPNHNLILICCAKLKWCMLWPKEKTVVFWVTTFYVKPFFSQMSARVVSIYSITILILLGIAIV